MQTEVFGEFGKTITLINRTTPIYNTWGDVEDYLDTSTSVVSVPYDIFWDRKSPQPFGELKDGEMALAVPYTVSVEKEDIFLIEDEYFKTTSVNKNWLPDNVVTILVLTRAHNYVAGTLSAVTNNFVLQDANNLVFQDGNSFTFQ